MMMMMMMMMMIYIYIYIYIMTVFLIFWRVDLKIIVREEGISPKTSQ